MQLINIPCRFPCRQGFAIRERFALDLLHRQFLNAKHECNRLQGEKSLASAPFCQNRPNPGDWRAAAPQSLEAFLLFSPEPRPERFDQKFSFLSNVITEVIMLEFSRNVSPAAWRRRPEVVVSQRNCEHAGVTETGRHLRVCFWSKRTGSRQHCARLKARSDARLP